MSKLTKYDGGDSIARYSPNSTFLTPFSARFPNELDNLFNELFNSFWETPEFLTSRNWRHSEVTQDTDNYKINIELPGFKRGEINVTVQGNNLKVSAQNNKSSYSRQFSLGDWQVDKVDVKLEDGVLYLTVPKSEKQKEKVIEIK